MYLQHLVTRSQRIFHQIFVYQEQQQTVSDLKIKHNDCLFNSQAVKRSRVWTCLPSHYTKLEGPRPCVCVCGKLTVFPNTSSCTRLFWFITVISVVICQLSSGFLLHSLFSHTSPLLLSSDHLLCHIKYIFWNRFLFTETNRFRSSSLHTGTNFRFFLEARFVLDLIFSQILENEWSINQE
jgi:hypothetical protein